MNPQQLAAALALVIAEQRVEIERLRAELATRPQAPPTEPGVASAPQPSAPAE